MRAPVHVSADTLPPDYFAPSPRCLWAVAFWRGSVYPFHRDRDGLEWRAGWTDAARLAYTPSRPPTVICSWCSNSSEATIQAIDRGERVTHTICPTCRAAMLADLDSISPPAKALPTPAAISS